MAKKKGEKTSADFGAEGGKARAKNLSPEKRREIAQKAAISRWSPAGTLVAEYGDDSRPLKIGPIEMSCYVLSDGRRVLSQRALQGGIGLSRSGGKAGARRVAQFLASLGSKGFDTNELIARVNSPVRFLPPHGGNIADGYEATILPDICAVVVKADQAGKLLQSQKHVADQCRVLLHGFANVGIIALVDEATGYQDVRARDALAKILEAFVSKELRPWVKTFPVDYFKELCRLRGIPFPAEKLQLPSYFGHLTNDIVYDRIAPFVRVELHRITPRNEKGRLKHKLFQRLTDDIGVPRLKEHLASAIALMKAAEDWNSFERMLDRALPKFSKQPLLAAIEGSTD